MKLCQEDLNSVHALLLYAIETELCSLYHLRFTGLVNGSVGTLTFTVEVPSSGDYAIIISYVTETTRDLSVSINNGDPEFIPFRGTGHWCFNETASSTVVPIEVKCFKQGTNTVTFGKWMVSSGSLL